MKLINNNFLFADRTVFLFGKPVFDTVAVMKVFTLQDRYVLTFVDLVVTYAANLFGIVFLFCLRIL